MIDELLCRFGKRIEGLRVDEIAAWVFEDAGMQIEVAQGAAAGVARTNRGKLLRKAGGSAYAIGQWYFICKEQIFDKRFRRLFELLARRFRERVRRSRVCSALIPLLLVVKSDAGFVIRLCNEVVHLRLMRENQVSHYVAVSGEIDGLVEAVAEMGDIRAGGAVQQFRMIAVLNNHIAHVLLAAACPCHIPAAPAVF